MPVIDLTGRTILVTGGSRGIGAVTVDVLQRAGATVLSHSRSGDLAFDLAEPGAGGRLWDAAVERAGRVDVLVANAGMAITADLRAAVQSTDGFHVLVDREPANHPIEGLHCAAHR